jgi:hypothetical protein
MQTKADLMSASIEANWQAIRFYNMSARAAWTDLLLSKMLGCIGDHWTKIAAEYQRDAEEIDWMDDMAEYYGATTTGE